jgi:hypothetical protein
VLSAQKMAIHWANVESMFLLQGSADTKTDGEYQLVLNQNLLTFASAILWLMLLGLPVGF